MVGATHVPETYNVSGARVVVRDLFQSLPEDVDNKVGGDVLFAQYMPGQKAHLTPRHLRNIAKKHHIDVAIPTSHPGAHLYKPAWQPSHDDLMKMIKDFDADFDADFDDAHVDIELVQVPEIKRNIGERDTCFLRDLQQRGAQNFQVNLHCQDTTYRILGKKMRYQEVPVLNRAFRPGEIVHTEDVIWVKMPFHKIQARHIQVMDHVVGPIGRRPLGPRTLLRHGDLKKPMIVKKGDTVDVRYKNGCIKLTLKTWALEDGALGDPISFLGYNNGAIMKNANKKGRKKIIMARITGPNQAVMET